MVGMHPRLRDARDLVAAGAVILEADGATVVSKGTRYRVRTGPAGDARCTCPWWGKHRGGRGPCKHALAAEIARGVARA